MSYLVVASLADAEARSARAWLDCGYEAAETTRLWPVLIHPGDGRAALRIAATPEGAQIGLSQAAYDALLSDDERARLVSSLPSDWSPPEL